jgi:hypothetical protein
MKSRAVMPMGLPAITSFCWVAGTEPCGSRRPRKPSRRRKGGTITRLTKGRLISPSITMSPRSR